MVGHFYENDGPKHIRGSGWGIMISKQWPFFIMNCE